MISLEDDVEEDSDDTDTDGDISAMPTEASSSSSFVLVVTEKGYGKRLSIDEFKTQRRGGKGVIITKFKQKAGGGRKASRDSGKLESDAVASMRVREMTRSFSPLSSLSLSYLYL